MALVLTRKVNLDTGIYAYERTPYEQKDGHTSQREEPGIVSSFFCNLQKELILEFGNLVSRSVRA